MTVQVSLLGGLGSHTLRPDRVYATGVLSPMTGYRPGEAVMTVAQNFTQGPYTGMTLSGPSAWGAKLRTWWEGVKARARAGNAMILIAPNPAQPVTAAQPTVSSPGNDTPGIPQGNAYGHYKQHNIAPMASYGENFGPASQLPHAMTARAYGQSPSLPPYAAEAATKTTMMMWRGMRWPWG